MLVFGVCTCQLVTLSNTHKFINMTKLHQHTISSLRLIEYFGFLCYFEAKYKLVNSSFNS